MMLPPDYVRRDPVAPMGSPDRGRLFLLVLEGGHALLARARAALAEGDTCGFVADLQRTQAVLRELVQALDRAQSGAIAAELARLHAFLVGDLALLSAERSLERVDAVLGAYAPVLDAYRELVRREAAAG